MGIYSICSANSFVLEAGMLQAAADNAIVCVESTSNQVNQFGGYAGMTPARFAEYVREAGRSCLLPAERIMLGGDHLGPHVWQNEPAESAMEKAGELVRQCILAGYKKIHLDTSMRLADDPGERGEPPPEEVVTRRAAELCEAAESACSNLPAGDPAPLYVIGTEVPIPGGERSATSELRVTKVEDVERSLTLTRDAFLAKGLRSAWDRVIAVVVQPGVEFGDVSVFEYKREKTRSLSTYIERGWNLVYEAHSTDYQLPERFRQMVEDHFAILKVGPWLTFAFREAVFALAQIETEWLRNRKGVTLSNLLRVADQAMLDNPAHWKAYYHGDNSYLEFARKFSYSDRIRYYWPVPAVREALQRLLSNLTSGTIPATLLSQYLPQQYAAVREGRIASIPHDLILDKVMEVVEIYARACGMRP